MTEIESLRARVAELEAESQSWFVKFQHENDELGAQQELASLKAGQGEPVAVVDERQFGIRWLTDSRPPVGSRLFTQAPIIPDVDWLSNIIREVDGNHNLGSGVLAEKIVYAMLSAALKP